MSKKVKPDLSTIAKKVKAKRAVELVIANKEKAELAAELVIADAEKAERADELVIANKEKAKRAAELVTADKEKAKRAAELVIANKEKAKRAAELVTANKEKAKRAAELVIANEEKAKRAAELVIAKAEKAKRAAESVVANAEKAKRALELVIANEEKEKRADELIIADKELVYQNEEKGKREAELVIADINKTKREAELVIAKIEKAKRSAELVIADKELSFQTKEKSKRAAELVIADAEKAKRAAELVLANINKAKRSAELVIANVEKAKRSVELVIANKELVYQKKEKAKRSAELIIANVEKAKRSAELVIANIEKSKRAAEFVFMNKELVLSKEKEKLMVELTIVNKELNLQINERKLAELELIKAKEKAEENEKQLKQSDRVFNLTLDMFCIAGFDGYFKYLNPAWERTLGWSIEELLSKPWLDFVHPDDAEQTENIKSVLVDGKEVYIFVNRYICKDGSIRWFSWNSQPFPKENIMIGAVRDITESKRIENELLQAKEKAEESDRLKTAFLNNMSHEIRTPMNGILGFAKLLKKPNLTSEKQHEFIEIIGTSGERMLNTINNIVDISKIEAGLMSVYISESHINMQIEFIYKFFTPIAENKGLQLSFNNGLSSNEAIIKTDSGKINSILTNLVNNAIKYTDEGSVEFGYTKKGKFLEFFVKDTGIGIPKDRLDAIFERFIQADIEDKRAFQGSGLGLSISKKYVEMLGGKIWVESQEGLGSTFYFTMPYTIDSEDKNVINNSVPADDNEVKIKNLKILIAEDEEASTLFLTEALQEISHKIIYAETGIEAIEACRSNPGLDLILMDIKMPKMDGHEATRQIRLFNTDIIIIAQTAHAFAVDKKMAIESGCNDYISKPIEQDELLTLIQSYFNK